MIGLNRLSTFERPIQSVVEDFILLLEPFAPYIAAELWESIGKTGSITEVAFPLWNETYLAEKSFQYGIAVNGKLRTKMVFDCNASPIAIEKAVLAHEVIQKWIAGKVIKNVVVVANKMVNVVLQ